VLLHVLSVLSGGRHIHDSLDDGTAVLTRLGPREDVRAALSTGSFDLVLIDDVTLARRGGPSLAELREHRERPEVIVFVAREDAAARARHLADGALAVIYRELEPEALRRALSSLLERRREEGLARERLAGPRPEALEALRAESAAMRACLSLARRVAGADSSLLVLGETGAGKEHLARAIHASGPRARGPFVAVNCAAFPEGLLESELFGHVPGAFTGAQRTRRGHFELAHRGTLLLDEVGELPQHLQSKLLRVLQERRVVPVGAERALEVDVRVIAATHHDLEAEVAEGRFRADLYFRLAVVTLAVPPVRARPEDLPALIDRCLEQARARLKRPRAEVSPEVRAMLAAYPWPGNVRELGNVLERALLLSADGRVEAVDLPDGLRSGGGRAALVPAVAPLALEALLALPWRDARDRALAELEGRYFRALLARTQGRVGEAARLAGLDPRSLYAKMRQLGLRKEAFRAAAAARADP